MLLIGSGSSYYLVRISPVALFWGFGIVSVVWELFLLGLSLSKDRQLPDVLLLIISLETLSSLALMQSSMDMLLSDLQINSWDVRESDRLA